MPKKKNVKKKVFIPRQMIGLIGLVVFVIILGIGVASNDNVPPAHPTITKQLMLASPTASIPTRVPTLTATPESNIFYVEEWCVVDRGFEQDGKTKKSVVIRPEMSTSANVLGRIYPGAKVVSDYTVIVDILDASQVLIRQDIWLKISAQSVTQNWYAPRIYNGITYLGPCP